MDWNELHKLQRHQLQYPSEEVVRFLAAAANEGKKRFLDIGCGAGRHMRLAAELGMDAYGTDSSSVAIDLARPYGSAAVAPMNRLPYEDDSFGAALAFGVFYYGTFQDIIDAVGELHRILEPGGAAMVSLRTPRDYRYGLGEPLSWQTFRLRMPRDPEDGATVTFVADSLVSMLFERFAGVWVETAERTTHNRLVLQSDWLVTVRK